MNGTQATGTNPLHDPSRVAGQTDVQSPFTAGFMHPDEVAADTRLTLGEKRALLASWASDARAVPDAPALRQLDNGAVLRVDDILRVLHALDEPGAPAARAARHLGALRLRLPRRLKSALRRNWSDDDDDDPPPCPAVIRGPVGGPLSGGAVAVSGIALAA